VGAVDHDEIVRLSDHYWDKHLPIVPRTSYPTDFSPAVFGGGEKRELSDLDEAHVSVAFEASSWPPNNNDLLNQK